ncbi:MAG: hypothetical protein ACPGJV_00170 [Bacteriovoracaceae bacterium]
MVKLRGFLSVFFFLIGANSFASNSFFDVSSYKKGFTTDQDARVKKFASFGGSFSLIDTWLPAKLGGGLSFNWGPSYTSEFLVQYSDTNTLFDEVGEFAEYRFSFLGRYFPGDGAFNIIHGFFYQSFKIFFSDEAMDSLYDYAKEENTYGNELVQRDVAGITLGVGSRWFFKNQVFMGVDWFALNVPIYTAENRDYFSFNTSERDKGRSVQKVVESLDSIPACTFIKVDMGYRF